MKILITGGANGIGRELAIHYTNNGHNVIIVDNDYQQIKELEENYTFLNCYHCDLTIPDELLN